MNNKFSEQDSLKLIAQMLEQTKQNMRAGSGNIFLYYGYFSAFLSLVVFVLLELTQEPLWAGLWFLMFLPWLFFSIRKSQSKPHVVTYMDRAIGSLWSVVGALFALSAIAIALIAQGKGASFALMMPLSLLFAGIGVAVTGVITKVGILVYTPLLAFAVAIYMLLSLMGGGEVAHSWHLLVGLSFVVMMVLPGHVLNKQSAQICSKS